MTDGVKGLAKVELHQNGDPTHVNRMANVMTDSKQCGLSAIPSPETRLPAIQFIIHVYILYDLLMNHSLKDL